MTESDKANIKAIIQGHNKIKPIKLPELSALSHICERTCKMIVNELRMNNERISGGEAGYYWASSPDDMLEAINKAKASIHTINLTIKAMEETRVIISHDKQNGDLF